MKEMLLQFVKTNKNYRGYDLRLNIVDKVWNHGSGSINLFRFYADKKIIVINRTFFNKWDERKLKEFCRDFHLENWKWRFSHLGYPDYYTKNLSLLPVMGYRDLSINERINFKSWRLSDSPKLLKSDLQDSENYEFWNSCKGKNNFPCLPADEKNRNARMARKYAA